VPFQGFRGLAVFNRLLGGGHGLVERARFFQEQHESFVYLGTIVFAYGLPLVVEGLGNIALLVSDQCIGVGIVAVAILGIFLPLAFCHGRRFRINGISNDVGQQIQRFLGFGRSI